MLLRIIRSGLALAMLASACPALAQALPAEPATPGAAAAASPGAPREAREGPSPLAPQAPASAQAAAPGGPDAPTSPAEPAAKPKPAAVAAAPKKPAPPPPEPKISQDPRPTYHPDSAGMIARAAELYADIAARGGWPTLPEGLTLRPGERNPTVVVLRSRLAAEGEDGGDGASPIYDPALVQAVKRMQGRYGLPQSGIVGPATVKQLNVPADARQRALAFSAQRLAASSFAFGPRHVVVNIPSAAVEAIENDAVAHRYVAVAGDPDHPSPTVEARIGAINFNPTWTVPVSIIRKEIIPKMRKDPGYLAKSNIKVLDGSGTAVDPASIDWSGEKAVNYTLRQDSGTGNSLGVVRIAMPNSHAVYMHDTPSKRLFGRDFRFLSHGCVRVSGVLDLVTWLLQPQGWTRAMVDSAVASPAREDVRITQAVPVAWVYLTGYVTADGAVHFRDDVYGLDKPLPDEEMTTATIAPVVR